MKIGILTINDLSNFGNRLQNYALYYVLNKVYNYNVDNIWLEKKPSLLKYHIKKISGLHRFKRYINFYEFNKLISTKYRLSKKYDCYIVGSDQVWNPNWAATDELLLKNVDNCKKISYAASFGVSTLNNKQLERFKKALSDFDFISVRENDGKKIIDSILENDKTEVVVDPTMLLTREEWSLVGKMPQNYNGEKYVLNYFLGDLSDKRKKIIETYAKERNLKIINILSEEDQYYSSGPAEFIWLEEHAEMIFTDSFHASLFAFLFDKSFVVFNREEKGMENMGSRIDTLLSKFELKNRRFDGKSISEENIKHDYKNSLKILEEEKKKSYMFIEKSLYIGGKNER